MNTDQLSSVETEDRKREQSETQTTPSIWEPAVGPVAKPVEEQIQSVRKTDDVSPIPAVSQYSSDLSFGCVLIPRFSDHYLVGDIVDCLRDWMQQACISYGWRLDGLSIRPGYMQWVINVPLDANPARFMKLVRRYTSEKIFENFPRFKQKNISGEFWAPGNFVVPGNQLQTPEQVNECMLQTRRMQGIV